MKKIRLYLVQNMNRYTNEQTNSKKILYNIVFCAESFRICECILRVYIVILLSLIVANVLFIVLYLYVNY